MATLSQFPVVVSPPFMSSFSTAIKHTLWCFPLHFFLFTIASIRKNWNEENRGVNFILLQTMEDEISRCKLIFLRQNNFKKIVFTYKFFVEHK